MKSYKKEILKSDEYIPPEPEQNEPEKKIPDEEIDSRVDFIKDIILRTTG